jgi:hypothetical protein
MRASPLTADPNSVEEHRTWLVPEPFRIATYQEEASAGPHACKHHGLASCASLALSERRSPFRSQLPVADCTRKNSDLSQRVGSRVDSSFILLTKKSCPAALEAEMLRDSFYRASKFLLFTSSRSIVYETRVGSPIDWRD